MPVSLVAAKQAQHTDTHAHTRIHRHMLTHTHTHTCACALTQKPTYTYVHTLSAQETGSTFFFDKCIIRTGLTWSPTHGRAGHTQTMSFHHPDLLSSAAQDTHTVRHTHRSMCRVIRWSSNQMGCVSPGQHSQSDSELGCQPGHDINRSTILCVCAHVNV